MGEFDFEVSVLDLVREDVYTRTSLRGELLPGSKIVRGGAVIRACSILSFHNGERFATVLCDGKFLTCQEASWDVADPGAIGAVVDTVCELYGF